ncbi:MAG TPA: helix-turn-helix transcriptional regulator [Ktedonobacteraceae bacterium]|jgi:transcriptional regulator with XRE-family HTH domain
MSAPQPAARSSNGVPVPQLILLRKQACLSQRALAERAGLSLQTITRLEHGANARYDTICLLSQALQVPPNRLVRRRRLRSESRC